MPLEGCDEGTGPITIGRQTEGGRAANGEAETEEVTEDGSAVDDEGPHPDGNGVEVTPGVPAPDSPELDPDDAMELNNPPTVTVEPIRGGSAGSDLVSCAAGPTTFPVVAALGIVVESCPSGGGACVNFRGKARGVDVSGGGSGPTLFFTLRLSGGSSGTALSFFLELLLPLTGSADDDAD